MSVQGSEPAGEPGGDYAELHRLLEQAIRYLEGSDLHSASAKLERACNMAASLWEADELPGLTDSRTLRIRRTDAGLVSRVSEVQPRDAGSRGT